MKIEKKIESETGNLYYDCFVVFDKNQWHYQGKLLADQLGLTSEQVKGKKCMDGGCGHGALSYVLNEMGASEVYAVDLKPCQKEDQFINSPNVHFIQESLLNLSFPDKIFDLVVSSGVIHHTLDPEKAFFEMTRVLKSGGRMVLGVYGRHGLFPWCLWVARLFTVKIKLIPMSMILKIINFLKLNPIWRYQVLDYLYVPILKRYTQKEVINLFLKYGIQNPHRISNITSGKAKMYMSNKTSYSYDYRSLLSRILFGHGFIVVDGIKK